MTGTDAPDLSGIYLFPRSTTIAPVPLAASSLVIPTVGPTAITNQPRQPAPVGDDWKDLYGAEDVNILEAGHLLSREIRIAGLLSKHSYQDGDFATVTEDLIPFANDQAPGFPVYLDSDDQYDQQAYVWLNTRTRTMYIAFRGTQTYADIMHDFDYRLLDLETEDSLVQGHAGFINKFNSIRAELEEIVDASLSHFNRIIITGHSLGGALATIAAPVLGEQHPQKFVECITFGSPRVGGTAFSAFYNAHVDSSYRIINESDPVPHLPFHAPFQHVSDAYHITSEGDLVTVPEVPAEQKLLYALMHFNLDHMTETHDLDIYMGRVQSIFSRLWHSAEELLKSGSTSSLGEDELRTPTMSSGHGKEAITAEDGDNNYAYLDVDKSTDAGSSTDGEHVVIKGLPDESSSSVDDGNGVSPKPDHVVIDDLSETP